MAIKISTNQRQTKQNPAREDWVNGTSEDAKQAEWAARLVTGQITLAEYIGLSKKELYVIAQQAYQLLNSGKLEEAREIYQGLVAADPYDSVFHCHLGATQLRLGQTDAAFEQFNAAIQYNIANIDALAGRGEILLMRGDFKEAIADLRKVLELDQEGKRPSTARARALLMALKDSLEKQSNVDS